MPRQLQCNVLRGRRMLRDIGKSGPAFADVFLIVWPAEKGLQTGFTRVGVEEECSGFAELSQTPDKCPAGDDARKRCYVTLRIAAVEAERMQLKDFAREIFVEPAPGALTERRVRPNGDLVIEIKQHCRMALDRLQHLAEVSQYVRADSLALESAGRDANETALCRRDTEMVCPKRDKPFDETGPCREGAAQPS